MMRCANLLISAKSTPSGWGLCLVQDHVLLPTSPCCDMSTRVFYDAALLNEVIRCDGCDNDLPWMAFVDSRRNKFTLGININLYPRELSRYVSHVTGYYPVSDVEVLVGRE